MAKKSFKTELDVQPSGAAMAFITRSQDEEEQAAERKSKRLNLLIKPSLYANMRKIAHMERTSVNNLMDIALNEYAEAHREQIEAYNAIYGEEE